MPEKRISEILSRAAAGDRAASEALWDQLYAELKQMAHRQLLRDRAPVLQTTTLVHETYLRLAGREPDLARSRSYFLGASARAMHRVLIDSSRDRRAQKRGGDRIRVSLSEVSPGTRSAIIDALALGEALDDLRELHGERPYATVLFRFLGGLTQSETAELLGVSRKTVERDWIFAQTWLKRQLSTTEPDPS